MWSEHGVTRRAALGFGVSALVLSSAGCAANEETMKRGFNISPRGSDYRGSSAWITLWSEWDWNGKIKRDLELAASVGGRVVRVVGGIHAVISGAITEATYLRRLSQVIDHCALHQVKLYLCGFDTRIWNPDTLPTEDLNSLVRVQSRFLDEHREQVFGHDLVNELAASYSAYGGAFQASEIQTTAGRWIEIAKEVAPSVPCTISMLDGDSLTRFTSHAIDPLLDFYDLHIYGRVSMKQLNRWTEKKRVVIGEFGLEAGTPDRYAAMAEMVAAMLDVGVSAALQWDIASDNFGLFDSSGTRADVRMSRALRYRLDATDAKLSE